LFILATEVLQEVAVVAGHHLYLRSFHHNVIVTTVSRDTVIPTLTQLVDDFIPILRHHPRHLRRLNIYIIGRKEDEQRIKIFHLLLVIEAQKSSMYIWNDI